LDQNEKTQSKLAGWLFPGGRVHMFFAFQKSWKKKLGLVVVLLPLSVKNAEDVVTTSSTRKSFFGGRGRALME